MSICRSPDGQPLIVLTDPIDPTAIRALEEMGEVRIAQPQGKGSLACLSVQASVLIVRSPIAASILSAASRLRGMVRYGAGIDMIPIAQASEQGIAVTNVPDANSRSVAEYALGQIVSLARQLPRADHLLRREGWAAARALAAQGVDLHGKRLAIVGMGNVGRQLAGMASAAFQMKVLGVRQSASPMPEGIEHRTLEQALPEADFLVLACPLSEQTRGLLNGQRLGLMKPSAYVVNVARGPVVDEGALIHALVSGQIAGAVLDVFEQEPLPANSRLFEVPGLVLSPHLAGITQESMRRIGEVVVTQTQALLAGRLPEHLVNLQVVDEIQARLARLAV